MKQVEPVEHVPMAKAVEIEPLDSSDWEILELRAGHLEAVLLDQLFVLSAGQVSCMCSVYSLCVW